jgi:hypothetical protein
VCVWQTAGVEVTGGRRVEVLRASSAREGHKDVTRHRLITLFLPIEVAARSKARSVFARSNTEIVGSNFTGSMDVCVCSVCVFSVST